MATLHGALSQAETDVLSASKLARYPEGGGGRVKPGFELGTIAAEFIAGGDVETLRLLLEQDELSGKGREDYALRISEETLRNLDVIAAQLGVKRIAAVRALLSWRKKALEAEAAASSAPEGRTPSEFTVSMSMHDNVGGSFEAEVSAENASEAAAAAYSILVDYLLDADARMSHSIKVRKNRKVDLSGSPNEDAKGD